MEFYYSYKKHVKVGRNGSLVFGEVEPLESRATEEELDHKVSQVTASVFLRAHPFILQFKSPCGGWMLQQNKFD